MSEYHNASVQPRHYTRGLSPLMVRIMVVNAIALIILVGGVLYLNQFRDNLIEARTSALLIQAKIIAGAVGESASGGPEASEIDLPAARNILTRLVGPTELRARLFSFEGGLLVDSRFLAGDKRLVEEPLGAFDGEESLKYQIEETILDVLNVFTRKPEAPLSVDRPGMRAIDFVEVLNAIEGVEKSQIRVREDGQYVVNVAVPVQRFRRVLGVLLLTGQTEDIEAIVRSEQLLTVQVFAGAFTITLLLSFFLGRTLVRPIRVLARSAERVRRGIGREERIPEFAERLDEIGDLSRSLSDMTRALYNQIDAVERFAADVAHEIKNPLSSMRSALETLQMTDKPDVQKRLFAILAEDVKRVDRLISDISDASRLDAELTRGKMEIFDLGAMMTTLLDAYSTMNIPRDIQVRAGEFSDRIFRVKGIEARLGQVWRNLIDNAISFSPEGGSVRISITSKNKYVTLMVDDDGPGLPDGAEQKIFKRFYSERPDNEAFGNHSGLGLAISKQVIEAHGGRISAENRRGSANEILGARFTVQIPAAET
ncbi:stimulus-sensing domain-containing protein [Kordiimonas sp. SCSIO 12610]|uniref:stimulus-sensing domain-containing protein n=1 Tax=Kordiimonas sp. SCSIO 12610 TaxID=2829597 RepID=UPI00210D7D58|nr:stimulus-sensing domain-containing protein [Kordiimonas sp. SCSIO 12610]UTW55233.1 sensor N-terminal transmembrane domain-containing protein [Kordiimonas sp. SCSIO 12610]